MRRPVVMMMITIAPSLLPLPSWPLRGVWTDLEVRISHDSHLDRESLAVNPEDPPEERDRTEQLGCYGCCGGDGRCTDDSRDRSCETTR